MKWTIMFLTLLTLTLAGCGDDQDTQPVVKPHTGHHSGMGGGAYNNHSTATRTFTNTTTAN